MYRFDEAYILSLGNELTGVELGNDALQHLVDNRRQHSFVVVGTELSVAMSACQHRPIAVSQEAHMVGRSATDGRESTRQVMLTC